MGPGFFIANPSSGEADPMIPRIPLEEPILGDTDAPAVQDNHHSFELTPPGNQLLHLKMILLPISLGTEKSSQETWSHVTNLSVPPASSQIMTWRLRINYESSASS